MAAVELPVASPRDSLSAVLESDLRLLSAETRRSEGFTSWLTGPDFPQIKEAAERGVLKLRSTSGRQSSAEAVQKSKELLKPFLLACESKNAKLASIALVSFQKLLANDAVSEEGVPLIIAGLEQVEKLHDEGVQLKILQTALTLLQSPVHAHLEDSICAVLSICFRLLGTSRNSDSVVSTAAATVRQAVALVFDHISIDGAELQPPTASPGSDASADTSSGSANAALKLLDDLCLMASGTACAWLRSPILPKSFVLELLDFVLGANSRTFQTVAIFEHALLSRVCHLLLAQLSDLLDPTIEGHSQLGHLRIVQRCSRTVLRGFHAQLGAKCGAFIEVLLSGIATTCALWQRVSSMQTIRQLCEDAALLHHLFVSYDMKWEVKLSAVQKVTESFADIIQAALAVTPESPDEDVIAAVAALFAAEAAGKGKHMTSESDFTHASPDAGTAYVVMLAIDSMLAIINGLETLTSEAIQSSEHPAQSSQQQGEPVGITVCQAIADRLSNIILQTLSMLLQRCSSDAILTRLFKGYQSFAEACGRLEMTELRDTFIRQLNSFVFTIPEDSSEAGAAQPPVQRQQRVFLHASEHATLDPRNVLALHTLFAIAHSLALLLGESWLLVLGTVNCLDRILSTPRQAAQGQDTAGRHHVPLDHSELTALSAATDRLFQDTAGMEDEAVVTLLGALHLVSAASLPSAGQQPGHTKLYALERMVQVLHFNMHRIYDLWGIFLSHVLEVLASAKAALRTAAMDAVGKAITGALDRPVPAQTDGTASTAEAEGGVENMLLVALTSLYTDEREADVRLGVLRVAINVLQRHGERLTRGWVPLLRLLAAVPERGGTDAIKLGFQSVELMCSDYMAALPVEQLRRCLEVAAMYANQQEDLNVTLTAISQLWNAADFLARLPHPDSGGSSGAAAGQQHGGVDRSQYADLLEILFNALQRLSTDGRPEVRNSGVRTLYSVVVSHGAHLSREQWQHCWWSMLFPLLRTVHHMSTTSSREEAQAEVLGKLSGESVKMLVHHSRNSEQKQWDETLVLALAGMSRLLRAHLRTLLAVVPRFQDGWEELMLVVESSMAGGRHETAVAAVALLSNVLQAHAATDAVSRAMWKRALRALGVGVEAGVSPQCRVPLQARLEMVSGIATLLGALPGVFDTDDMRTAFLWLEKFVRNPWSHDDANVYGDMLLPVQKAALGVFQKFTSLPREELWHELMDVLTGLLRPEQLEQDSKGRQTFVTAATMAKVVSITAAVYTEHLPGQLRAEMLTPLVAILGRCMATRHTAPGDPLWRAAAVAFQQCMSAGLPATNIAYVSQAPPVGIWEALAIAFESFFLAQGVASAASLDNRMADDMGSPARSSEADAAAPAEEAPDGGAARATLGADGMAVTAAGADLDTGTAAAPVPSAPGSPDPGGSSPPAAADTHLLAPQHTLGSRPTLGSQRMQQHAPADLEQAGQDAGLEVAVLDTLTDTVLTACPFMPPDMCIRYVQILDRGITRPHALNFAAATSSTVFSHVCLRKLYVLCSRGGSLQGSQKHLLQIAQAAFPIILVRCRSILQQFAADQRSDPGSVDSQRMEEVVCVLEVSAAMTVSPLVACSAESTESPMTTNLLQLLRSQAPAERRERAHLLYLYDALIGCVLCREPRVRQQLHAVLQLAGAELGLAPGA